MKRKFNKIVKLFKEYDELIFGFNVLILFLTIMEGLGVVVAVLWRNYIVLSLFTYIWVYMLTVCFIEKYFFERLDKILLKKPQVSRLIFLIVAFITILLSWKYFIAFVLCIPQAILYGEYCRFKIDSDIKKRGG